MDNANLTQTVQERRNADYTATSLWSRLSVGQKFAANSLTHFGYELAFVRRVNNDYLAVMMLDNNLATVNEDGDIDTSPNIAIR